MRFRLIALLFILLAAFLHAENQAPIQDIDGLSVPQGTLAFRSAGGTETMYLIIKPDQTYSLLVRAHFGTMEFDHGAWVQDEYGEMELTSQKKEGTVSHIRALRYKAHVVLVSTDHDFISISASSVNEVQKEIDEAGSERPPYGLFLQVNAEKAAEEASTPQPFIFYPELNQPRPHGITLQEGSPLASGEDPDGTDTH